MQHFHTGLSLASAALCGLLLAGPSSAQNSSAEWPFWRGPDRDGISKETGLKVEGKELWRKDIGLGYSAVSIADGRLYTLGHDKEKKIDTVFCFDAETGEEIWTHRFECATWDKSHGGGTQSTPTIDGDVVYVANREGRLFCFEAKTGVVRWEIDLTKKYGLKLPTWAFAASPLILGDVLVMNVGLVLALEKKSGKLIWKTARNYGDAYSTPEPMMLKGQPALAVFSGDGLVVIDQKQGKELQFHEWKTRFNINPATPVAIGEKVFISSGYNHGCAMLDLSGEAPEVLWESKVMRTKMAGVCLYEGHLYGYDERVFKCLDLEGNEKWTLRGLGNCAFTIADGKLILLSSKGELVIAKAQADAFEELSREKIFEMGKRAVCWTTPVVLGGRIYCRNSAGELVCRDHR